MASTDSRPAKRLFSLIDSLRRDFLGIVDGNPLLQHQMHLEHGLHAINSTALALHRDLYAGRQKLSFASWDGSTAIAASDRTSLQGASLEDQRESLTATCGTFYGKEELEKRLLAMYYSARATVEEDGVSSLFLTLGFLHWKHDKHDLEVNAAPLVLMPVEMHRTGLSDSFTIQYTGKRIISNATLAEALKAHGINLPVLSPKSAADLSGYFEQVRQAIKSQRTWSVDDTNVSLSSLPVARLAIYEDLNPLHWEHRTAAAGLKVLDCLMSEKSSPGATEPSRSESHSADDDAALFNVLEADSTQTLALMDIEAGNNLVINGPPGTGKSQTIVNVIANAIAKHKSVLFISEHRAALDVVKNRLNTVGLANAVLDLHSAELLARDLIRECEQTRNSYSGDKGAALPATAALVEMKKILNEYRAAINTPLSKEEAEVTAYRLMGDLVEISKKLKGVTVPDLHLEGALHWTAEEVSRRREALLALQAALTNMVSPSRHPFWGAGKAASLPTTYDRLRSALALCADQTASAHHSGTRLAKLFHQPVPMHFEHIRDLIAAAKSILNAPAMGNINLRSPWWQTHFDELSGGIQDGIELEQLLNKWKHRIRPEAWSMDLRGLREALTKVNRAKFFSPREHLDFLANSLGIPVSQTSHSKEETAEAITAIERVRAIIGRLNERTPLLEEAFGHLWKMEKSDWSHLSAMLSWIADTKGSSAKGGLPAWILNGVDLNVDKQHLQSLTQDLESATAAYEAARDALTLIFEKEDRAHCIKAISDASQDIGALECIYRELAKQAHEFNTLNRYLHVRATHRDCLSKQLLEAADTWELARTHLVDAFDFQRLSALMDDLLAKHPALEAFDSTTHEGRRSRYRTLDLQAMASIRQYLAALHMSNIGKAIASNPGSGHQWGPASIETGSISELLKGHAADVQKVKPVFLMSPVSVATFLPPEAIHFDIVIFDEASQLRPIDAFGSILRSKQVVVVGDEQQLPPSDPYGASTARNSNAFKPENIHLESILDWFCARGVAQRTLRWHYRSKHESLIAQSNSLFYKDELIIFPSPDRRRMGSGLICQRVTLPERSSSIPTQGAVEAHYVTEAILRHASEQVSKPRSEWLTLGVATLTAEQRDVILCELDYGRTLHPECEEFFSRSAGEPFFVKSLASVQGDERDVIFISVGCRKPQNGSGRMDVGLMSEPGGDRRLNVLFTRARQRCEVFTTLSSSDISIDEDSPTGLVAFKKFLQYAETGRLNRSLWAHPTDDIAIERQIVRLVERLGYTIQRRVGTAGFFLDLAIVDPNEPSRYLLGILLDGPSYGNAASTRDCDRLHEEALLAVGWNIHRVWSAAWFFDPIGEEARLVQALSASSVRSEEALNVGRLH